MTSENKYDKVVFVFSEAPPGPINVFINSPDLKSHILIVSSQLPDAILELSDEIQTLFTQSV